GKRLIAHELTHVVQQGTRTQRTVDRLEISDPGDATEQEAEASTNAVLQGRSFIPLVGEAMHIARQGPLQTQTTAALTSPADSIREARIGASIRCLLAHQRVVGIGPPAPPGREDPALEWQRRARSLARKIFGIADPDMDMIDRI